MDQARWGRLLLPRETGASAAERPTAGPGEPQGKDFHLAWSLLHKLACDGHAEAFGEGTRVQNQAGVDAMLSGPSTGLCPELQPCHSQRGPRAGGDLWVPVLPQH